MCVIAIQPRGIQISKEHLENCWDNNNHGAGIMYAVNGKVIVKKEMKSFDAFYSHIVEASTHDTSVVIHFRIATSGGINDYNCHPFKVHKNLYFCHNGILDIDVPKGSKENDTQIFNNGLMKPLPYNFYKNNAIMNVLEFTIGSGNKFVFLDDAGDFFILNEKAGEWSEDGAWFSNTSYKRSSYVKSYGSYGGWADDWYEGYSKSSVSNSKTTYKYNKDAFDGEESVDEIMGEGEGFDYSICDCCSEWKEVDDVLYIRDWNSYMCSECAEAMELDEKYYIETPIVTEEEIEQHIIHD